jgi:hypothetical protein
VTQPTIVVRYFDEPGADRWARLARVLARSIARWCPDWTLDLQELPPASGLSSPLGLKRDVGNTRKLDAWAAAVAVAAPGDRVLLLDADTLVRRPLDEVWDAPFDLAYTTKPIEARHPFNGGVIFLRVSAATQAFMATWARENRRMLDDPSHHQVWRPAFGGINQSALGMLLKQGGHGLQIKRLPCAEWNLEDEHWDVFDPDRTRIVHYKSDLQRALFGKAERTYGALVKEWHAAAARPQETTVIPRADQDMQIRPGDLSHPEDGEPIQTPEPVTPPLSRRQQKRRAAAQAEAAALEAAETAAKEVTRASD